MPELGKDVLGSAPLIVFFVICALVLVKVIPLVLAHRKELRLAECEVRKAEANVKLVSAESQGKLAEVLRSSAEATDRSAEASSELRLFLRAVMREHSTIRSEQAALADRMANVESAVLRTEHENARHS